MIIIPIKENEPIDKALKKFKIGNETEWKVVEKMKSLRGDFDELLRQGILTQQEIFDYCKLECGLLARLMEKFRNICIGAGIKPDRWAGPGWLAAEAFKHYGIPKRPLSASESAKKEQEKIEAEERRAAAGKPPSTRKKKPDLRRPERDPELETMAW